MTGRMPVLRDWGHGKIRGEKLKITPTFLNFHVKFTGDYCEYRNNSLTTKVSGSLWELN